MRTSTFLLVGMLAIAMMVLTNTVQAETGIGVCAAGQGVSLYSMDGPDAFVGVNAGTNSESGAFTERAAYETQCCAELGEAPDCFSPVA